jgi:ubiquinone/menaquinone biosynthesis C-methylase UbiE
VKSELIAQWKRDEGAVFEGWDFSYIKGRCVEEEPGWDYRALARELVRKSAAVLDVATGGGEVFSSLAPFPGRAVAVEGYRPNVAVARKQLAPLGVEVVGSDGTSLPFCGDTFDLVLNRHGAFAAAEMYRILQEKGTFLTQQVADGNLIELLDFFGAKQKWPGNTLKIVGQRMQEVGFHIERGEEWKGKARFLDVGAVVYFLKAIPWIVDNFGVDSHLEFLTKLQEKLEREGRLEFTYARFLILARK